MRGEPDADATAVTTEEEEHQGPQSGAGRNHFNCKEGFLKKTALDLFLNYFLFSLWMQHIWLTAMYVNKYCYHTYKW